MMQPHAVNNATLLKSTVAAVILAAIALVTLILPAEYNIDPTGIGHKLRLTQLAQQAQPAVADAQPATMNASADAASEKLVQVTVPAGEGIEYKVLMAQYAKLEYEWVAFGKPLHFDLHGEPAGDTTGYFESYALGTSDTLKGSFTAPYAGTHGWYWENRSEEPVRVQLKIKGRYEELAAKG